MQFLTHTQSGPSNVDVKTRWFLFSINSIALVVDRMDTVADSTSTKARQHLTGPKHGYGALASLPLAEFRRAAGGQGLSKKGKGTIWTNGGPRQRDRRA